MISEIKLIECEGKLDKEFKVKKCIGKGSYGTVTKVKHKSDKTIHAIKKIKFDKIDDDFWVSGIRELKALHKARSDYVVQYRNAWIEKKCLCLQMEFCDSNLDDIIKEKSEHFKTSVDSYEMALIDYFISCELFQEILKSLNFLHTLVPPIIHRDIKPENILVSYNRNENNKQFLKLCDFGYAKPHNFSGQSLTRDTGSINYMAPEVGQSKLYDCKSDVYSVALIGLKLFEIDYIDNLEKIIDKKNSGIKRRYKYLEQPFLDMLQTIYRKRPSCSQVLARSHNWRLSYQDIEVMHQFNDMIEKMRNWKQKFFHTFLISKMEESMTDVCAGDQTDGLAIASKQTSSTIYPYESENERKILNPKEGEIIQITYDGDYDVITLWALYIGDGFVMYLWPSEQNEDIYYLMKEKLDSINQNKVCVVNNLDEFAQTRGLSPLNHNQIKSNAENVFKIYANQELYDKVHNLRIHFVTKCRFGGGICPQKDSLEEENTIFQI